MRNHKHDVPPQDFRSTFTLETGTQGYFTMSLPTHTYTHTHTHTQTRLHGVTSHKTATLLFGVVTISSLYKTSYFFFFAKVADKISLAAYSEKYFKQNCRENENKLVMFNTFFPRKSCRLCKKVKPNRPELTI